MSTETQFTGEVRRLEPGQPVEAALSGGEGHRYEIDLEAGHYVHLVVDQRGIDLVLRLRTPGAPEGSLLAAIDSPTGERGLEQFFAIPQTSGRFPVEIVSEDSSAPAGRYEVRLHSPRPATEADRRHVRAFQVFQEGESLRRQKEIEARRQAVAKYEEALALWRGLGHRDWEAECLVRIAQVRQDDLWEWDAALTAIQEALPLVRALGRRDLEGILLNRLGMIEVRKGRFSEAIELYRTAISIFQDIGAPGMEAGALNNLGGAYEVAGESQQGLAAYREGLEKARAAGLWPEEEASARRGIGEILLSQGKLEPAQDELRQSLAIYRQLQRPNDAADVLNRMAATAQRLGRLDEALTHLREALALKQQTGEKDGEVVTLNSLGTLHLLRNETAKAGEVYAKALSLARSTGNRLSEAFSVLNLGRQRFYAGQYQDAVRFHDEAAGLFQAIGLRRGEVSTLYGAARALSAMGEFAAARQRLDQVVNGVEMLRAEAENLDLRSSYFATRQHYFELYIDILMSLHEQDPSAGFDAEALALNERRRARGLLEALADTQAETKAVTDPDLLAQRQKLQQRINSAEAGIQRARGTGDEVKIAEIEEKQRARLIELADLEARIRGVRTGPAQPRPLTFSNIQKLVGPWGLLLVYSLGEEKSRLWSLTADGELHSHTLPPRARLERTAKKVRTEWSRRNGEREAERWAAQLSREILGPVAHELGERRLLIVADGTLEALPFAALPDPRDLGHAPGSGETAQPLVLRNEIVHLPSVGTLATLRRVDRRAAPPSWIGIVADPVFSPADPRVQKKSAGTENHRPPANPDLARAAEDLGIESFDRLPFTRFEAETIAGLVSQKERHIALDFEASRDFVVSQELKRYRILHFATHGLLNAKHPELSGLVLSLVDPQGNPRDDGFLLAHEISNLDLRAHLVVLSACQTGLGDEVRGEGLVSLTRSFMQAGVPKVVVSLWNVNDRATSELMTRFYRALIDNALPPSSALRCAQISMMRKPEWSSPYFWAPFIFQGDWQTRGGPGEPPVEKQSAPSQPPRMPDDDYPPPGSKGAPPCPDLD